MNGSVIAVSCINRAKYISSFLDDEFMLGNTKIYAYTNINLLESEWEIEAITTLYT